MKLFIITGFFLMDKYFNLIFFILLSSGIYFGKTLFLAQNFLPLITISLLLPVLLIIKKTRIVSVMFLSGIFLFSIYNLQFIKLRNSTIFKQDKQKIIITGTIKNIRKKSFTTSIILKTDTVYSTTQSLLSPLQSYMSFSLMGNKDLFIGDHLTVRGVFNKFAQKRNIHDFDFNNYAFNNKIIGQLNSPKIIKSTTSNSIYYTFFYKTLYGSIENIYNNYLSYKSANFQKALFLGSKDDMEKEDLDKFAHSGTIHLLAVSGLHVGFLLLIILFVKKILKLNFYTYALLLIITLTCYIILTGSSPSVIRASLMVFMMIISYPTNRLFSSIDILSTAGIIALCFNPNQLFSLGFILSYTAVFSILTIYQKISALLITQKIMTKIGTIPAAGLNIILVSLSVSLGTFPIVMHIFGRFNLASLIANLLLIPLTALSYFCAVLLLILVKIPVINEFTAYSTNLINQIILQIIDFTAKLSITVIEFRFDLLTSFLAALFIIHLMTLKKKYFPTVTLLLSCIIMILLNLKVDDAVKLYAFSLPAGNSIFINTGTETILVLDNFNNKDLKRTITPHLKNENIKTINYLILPELKVSSLISITNSLKGVNIKEIITTETPKNISAEYQNMPNYISVSAISNILKLKNSRIYFLPATDKMKFIFQHESDSFLYSNKIDNLQQEKTLLHKDHIAITKKGKNNSTKIIEFDKNGKTRKQKDLQKCGGLELISNGKNEVKYKYLNL